MELTDLQKNKIKFKQIREAKKLTQAQFGSFFGVQSPAITKIESLNDRAKVPRGTVLILKDRLNLNPEWWKTGDGDMFLKEKNEGFDKNFEDGITQYSTIEPATEQIFVPRPVIMVSARASFIESYLNETPYEPMATFHVLKNSNSDDLYVIEINGSSMEPELRNGDRILAKNITDKNYWPYLTGIVAVMHGNNFNVKRIIMNELNINGTLTLISDNPQGGTYTVKGKEITAIMTYEDLVSRKDKR